MSIHGLTIDYGPYGWLEPFEVDWTPNTTDAGRRRYRYGHQVHIGAWNVARLLESMAPLMEDKSRLQPVLDHYMDFAMNAQSETWAAKLGLGELKATDEALVDDLLALLGATEVDMTLFFRYLCSVAEAAITERTTGKTTIAEPDIAHLSDAFYEGGSEPDLEAWNAWLERWWNRVEGQPDRANMRRANPKYVLRNWMAQLAIDAAEEKGDFSVAQELQELIKRPYDEQPEHEEKWFQKRPEWARHRVGCSMLSCSS